MKQESMEKKGRDEKRLFFIKSQSTFSMILRAFSISFIEAA